MNQMSVSSLHQPSTGSPPQRERGEGNRQPIRHLMIAIVQMQDMDSAAQSLTRLGMIITRLASTGGFLGHRNVTLLIGIPEGMEQAALNALTQCCHRRVEYLATHLEGAPFPLPLTTPIMVGGATVFLLDVDRFEEIV